MTISATTSPTTRAPTTDSSHVQCAPVRMSIYENSSRAIRIQTTKSEMMAATVTIHAGAKKSSAKVVPHSRAGAVYQPATWSFTTLTGIRCVYVARGPRTAVGPRIAKEKTTGAREINANCQYPRPLANTRTVSAGSHQRMYWGFATGDSSMKLASVPTDPVSNANTRSFRTMMTVQIAHKAIATIWAVVVA